MMRSILEERFEKSLFGLYYLTLLFLEGFLLAASLKELRSS
jgi:hypothetical protein